MENDIVVNEEEFENVNTSMVKSYVDVSSTGECVGHNFSGAVKSGLLGNSIGVIGRQMNSISHSIGKVNNLIQQYSEQLIAYDSVVSNKIDEIDVPINLFANNSSEVNTYTSVLLEKLDNRSVNEGQTAKEFSEIDDSIINPEELININYHPDVNSKEYDDSSIVTSEVLGDISKNDSIESANYDDSSRINANELTSMNESESTEAVNYDDNTIIREKSMQDVPNNQSVLFNNDYSNVIDEIIDDDTSYFNDENNK